MGPRRVAACDRPAGVRATEMTSGRYDCSTVRGLWINVEWLWQDPLPDPMACLNQILGRP